MRNSVLNDMKSRPFWSFNSTYIEGRGEEEEEEQREREVSSGGSVKRREKSQL